MLKRFAAILISMILVLGTCLAAYAEDSGTPPEPPSGNMAPPDGGNGQPPEPPSGDMTPPDGGNGQPPEKPDGAPGGGGFGGGTPPGGGTASFEYSAATEITSAAFLRPRRLPPPCPKP